MKRFSLLIAFLLCAAPVRAQSTNASVSATFKNLWAQTFGVTTFAPNSQVCVDANKHLTTSNCSNSGLFPPSANLSMGGFKFTGMGGINGSGISSNAASTAANPMVGMSVDGKFNVIAKGADPIDTNDSTSAIQAAVNADCAAVIANGIQPAVYLPAGVYKTTAPIDISCAQNITMFGDGRGVSEIAPSANFPAILTYPTTYNSNLGTITTTSLATGSGVAYSFPHPSTWYRDLDDVMKSDSTAGSKPLNGLPNFTYERFINWQPYDSTTRTYTIFSSSGNDGANPNAISPATTNTWPAGAVSIYISGSNSGAGALKFQILTNGGATNTTVTASAAVTSNATHVIAAVLDNTGTTDNHCTAGTPCARLFVDGTEVNNASIATGTIFQRTDEAMYEGGHSYMSQWPDATGNQEQFVGVMDSLRISNIARYTANYTAPTAKFTSDANTLILDNGDNVSSPLLGVDTPSGGYLVARQLSPTQGNSVVIHDLGIKGGAYGIFAIAAGANANIKNMFLDGMGVAAIKLWNNSYSTPIAHIYSSVVPIGIETTQSSSAFVRDFQVGQQALYGLVGDTGGSLSDSILSSGGGGLAEVDAQCQTATCDWKISRLAIDTENGGSVVPLKISANHGNFTIDTTDLETNPSANTPCIYVNAQNGNADASVVLNNVHCETGTPSELIDYIDTAHTYPIIISGGYVNAKPWTTQNVAALSNGPGNISILAANGFTVSKDSAAPSTAVGAGACQIFTVAGTNAGTCKLQAVCGTSTTPVTITDNIGSGC